jgi:hypothetical protein
VRFHCAASRYKDRSYFVEAIQNNSLHWRLQVGGHEGAASVGFGKPVYDSDISSGPAGRGYQQLAIALKGAIPADVQGHLTGRGTILGTTRHRTPHSWHAPTSTIPC